MVGVFKLCRLAALLNAALEPVYLMLANHVEKSMGLLEMRLSRLVQSESILGVNYLKDVTNSNGKANHGRTNQLC